jgi:transcription initiation factor TFIIIB Brf1 subunit/transcription initiation factor TFIIB
MDPYWDICSDCKESKMVWDRDGDMVCTNCGLVKNEKCISDEPEWRSYEGCEDECRVEVYINEDNEIERKDYKEFQPYLQTYDKTLQDTASNMYIHLKKQEVGTQVGTQVASQVASQVKLIGASSKKKLIIMSICVYLSGKVLKRSLSYSDICTIFQISDTSFWTEYNNVIPNLRNHKDYNEIVSSSKVNNNVSRIVHTLCDAYNFIDKWLLLKVSNDIYNKLSDVAALQSCKGSKISLAVVYYVCMTLKYNISRREFCNIFKTSESTLKKHCDKIKYIC